MPAGSNLTGTAGNNKLAASGGGLLDGKEGIDTAVFANSHADYKLSADGTNFSVVDFANGSKTTLANIERVQFSDQTLALDIHGNAGDAYRLYQAAFNRTPDKGGLGYWIDSMDGANPNDAQYVEALYANVLHRAQDAAATISGCMRCMRCRSRRAEALVNFSESAENQAQVIGAIQNGIDHTPWHG